MQRRHLGLLGKRDQCRGEMAQRVFVRAEQTRACTGVNGTAHSSFG